MNFENLRTFVNEMNTSNSNLDKIDVLNKYKNDDEIANILKLTYSPYIKFNVTSKNLTKNKDLITNNNDDLITLLNKLNERVYTGHDAISNVNGFISKNGNEDLIHKIIDKNLEIRVSVKTINKVFKNLIPEFSVALCENLDDHINKLNFEKDEWYLSPKLDGVRCLIFVDKSGNVEFLSRQGKNFETLQTIENSIKALGLKDVVLDGEVGVETETECLFDFQATMKQIKRKNHNFENATFYVFDVLTTDEFINGKSDIKFKDRMGRFKDLESSLNAQSISNIKILEQRRIWVLSDVLKLLDDFTNKSFEGIVLRKNDFYKGKRSNDLLKGKKFHDAEYKVLDIETGPFRIIEDGKEITIETLTNVIIEHKGNKVSVGSGFTLNERKRFYENPDDLLGKIITVSYFEESQNQNGEYSLRFPTIKHIYNGERDC